jgi:hypothetical protein
VLLELRSKLSEKIDEGTATPRDRARFQSFTDLIRRRMAPRDPPSPELVQAREELKLRLLKKE